MKNQQIVLSPDLDDDSEGPLNASAFGRAVRRVGKKVDTPPHLNRNLIVLSSDDEEDDRPFVGAEFDDEFKKRAKPGQPLPRRSSNRRSIRIQPNIPEEELDEEPVPPAEHERELPNIPVSTTETDFGSGSGEEMLQSTPISTGVKRKRFSEVTPMARSSTWYVPTPAQTNQSTRRIRQSGLHRPPALAVKEIKKKSRSPPKQKLITTRHLDDINPDTSVEQSPDIAPKPRQPKRPTTSQPQLSQNMNPSLLYGSVIQSSSAVSTTASTMKGVPSKRSFRPSQKDNNTVTTATASTTQSNRVLLPEVVATDQPALVDPMDTNSAASLKSTTAKAKGTTNSSVARPAPLRKSLVPAPSLALDDDEDEDDNDEHPKKISTSPPQLSQNMKPSLLSSSLTQSLSAVSTTTSTTKDVTSKRSLRRSQKENDTVTIATATTTQFNKVLLPEVVATDQPALVDPMDTNPAASLKSTTAKGTTNSSVVRPAPLRKSSVPPPSPALDDDEDEDDDDEHPKNITPAQPRLSQNTNPSLLYSSVTQSLSAVSTTASTKKGVTSKRSFRSSQKENDTITKAPASTTQSNKVLHPEVVTTDQSALVDPMETNPRASLPPTTAKGTTNSSVTRPSPLRKSSVPAPSPALDDDEDKDGDEDDDDDEHPKNITTAQPQLSQNMNPSLLSSSVTQSLSADSTTASTTNCVTSKRSLRRSQKDNDTVTIATASTTQSNRVLRPKVVATDQSPLVDPMETNSGALLQPTTAKGKTNSSVARRAPLRKRPVPAPAPALDDDDDEDADDERPKKITKEGLFGNEKLIPKKMLRTHFLLQNIVKTPQEIDEMYTAFNDYAEKFYDKLCMSAKQPYGMFSFKELETALKGEKLIGNRHLELYFHYHDILTGDQYKSVKGLLVPKDGESDTFTN